MAIQQPKAPKLIVIATTISIAVGLLALSPMSAEAASIGEVKKIMGDAYGTPPKDSRSRKYVRDDVDQDELVETSGGGALLIRFDDNSELFLGASSKMTLDEMVYEVSGKGDSMVLKLTQGAFRFVSGKVASQGVQLVTPSAHIGIRGSEAIIFVTPEGDTTVNVLKGAFTVRTREGSDAPAKVTPKQNVTVSSTGVSKIGQGVHIPKATGTKFQSSYDDVLRPGSAFDKASNGKVREKGGNDGGSDSGH